MQSELTGQNEVVKLQSTLLNIEAKSEYIGDNQGSEESMTKRNSGQEQRSGSRSVKATQQVKMAKGMLNAYDNISSSISGKSSEPIDYENGQWPQRRELEELEDLTPHDEK